MTDPETFATIVSVLKKCGGPMVAARARARGVDYLKPASNAPPCDRLATQFINNYYRDRNEYACDEHASEYLANKINMDWVDMETAEAVRAITKMLALVQENRKDARLIEQCLDHVFHVFPASPMQKLEAERARECVKRIVER